MSLMQRKKTAPDGAVFLRLLRGLAEAVEILLPPLGNGGFVFGSAVGVEALEIGVVVFLDALVLSGRASAARCSSTVRRALQVGQRLQEHQAAVYGADAAAARSVWLSRSCRTMSSMTSSSGSTRRAVALSSLVKAFTVSLTISLTASPMTVSSPLA